MIQEIKQTHEEKVEMYIKLTKKELAEMLIECNLQLSVATFLAKNLAIGCASTHVDGNNTCDECSKELERGTVFCSHDCRKHFNS